MMPSERFRTICLTVGVLGCFAAATTATGADATGSPVGAASPAPYVPSAIVRWLPAIELLHASRTEAALERFLELKDDAPGDPCGFYFPALVYLNFDVDGQPVESRLALARTLLEQGIDAGETSLSRADQGTAERYCTGALFALRAQDRLRDSKYVRAAFDGKRSRRIMLDLIGERPDFVDCRFWLGSYDYLAAELPKLIKILRNLLFLPAGDRDRGLVALEQVASTGKLDRYNALWMLVNIRQFESDDPGAAAALEDIYRRYPNNVDAMKMLARTYARAEPPRRDLGIELHREYLDRLSSDESTQEPRLRREASLSLANAYVDDLRPGRGIELLRPWHEDRPLDVEQALSVARVMTRALNHDGRHDEALALYRELQDRYGEAAAALERETRLFDETSSQIQRALRPALRAGREGRVDEAETMFRTLHRRFGDHAALYYARAELYVEIGRGPAAEAAYRRAIANGDDAPAILKSLAGLRLGNYLDTGDRRSEAKAAYRQAMRDAGDHENVRGAAKYYLKTPYE